MSAELERIFRAVQSEDRQSIMRDEIQREEEQAAREGRPPVDDALAALTALLRPKPPTQRKSEDSSDETARAAAADQLARIATDFPPYPVVEVHALIDRPAWTGQPTGKTVRVGNASTEWQAADNRGLVGTREKAKQSQQKTELGPQATGTTPGKHDNASTSHHCLEEYRRQTKAPNEQYRSETLMCRKPEKGVSNEEEAPGESHPAGSKSPDTALFRTPEAVVLTVSEVNAPPEVDTSQVQRSCRRREAARKAAAHRSKVHVTERVLDRKAKIEAAQTAQASVAPPAPQGGPQVTTLSPSAVINDRVLGHTGEPSRAPVSSAATAESGRTAPATEWTLVETSLSQREFDLFITNGTPVSPASRLREDARPSVVQEWVSTPVDCEASWIGLILDGRAAPDKGTRAEWVERAIQSVADSFVARRPDGKSSGTGLGSEDQTDARLGERQGTSPPPTRVGPMRAISEAPAARVREGASPSARGREKEKAKVHAAGSHEEVRQLTPPHAVKEPRRPFSNVEVGAPPSAPAKRRGRAKANAEGAQSEVKGSER